MFHDARSALRTDRTAAGRRCVDRPAGRPRQSHRVARSLPSILNGGSPWNCCSGLTFARHGRRVGRLAGFELEPAGLKVRRIIFSPDGELGPQAMTRPIDNVDLTHDDGEIELRPDVAIAPMPAVPDVVL